MFKLMRILGKPHILKVCACTNTRTFLSQAYYCNEIWENRLNSPLLLKVNLDVLYHELDQRFQKTRRLSAVDVDIFANSLKDDLFMDELMDLVHKLRLSPDTGSTLNSTTHAVLRTLLKHNKINELLLALDDRLNYGLFLDDYTANILMDSFWKEKNHMAGCVVAAQVMLQEDFKHPITANYALLHCYNYLLNSESGWPQPTKPEEPEEEVKVRVKYLRNSYNDEHFDLKEPLKIIGKTLTEATNSATDPLDLSLRFLGLTLMGDKERAKTEAQKSVELIKEVIDLIPKEVELEKEIQSKLISEDVGSLLEQRLIRSISSTSEKDIASQCELFTQWENDRVHALEEQKKRLLTAQRLTEIEQLQRTLKAKEEKLWFFENEEHIELAIQEGEAAVKPVEPLQKLLKEEETYVPPEVSTRKST